MKPILLLETRVDPMVFLTSRSLTILSISSQGSPIEYQYTHQDIPEMVCYGNSYELLGNPREDLKILARLGEQEYEYLFHLRS